MSVLDETWEADEKRGKWRLRIEGGGIFAGDGIVDMGEEYARVASVAPDALELLLVLERRQTYCTWCLHSEWEVIDRKAHPWVELMGRKREPREIGELAKNELLVRKHRDGCELIALLQKAGIR